MEDSPKEEAFYQAVPEAFRFLSDYGLTMQRREFGAFVAKSEKCFVEISLDWVGINMCLGSNNINPVEFETQPQTIELSHVIRCLDPHAAGEPSYIRSSFGVPEVVSEVHRRAELLKQYCVPFLAGDFSAWQKTQECVDDWLNKYSPLGGTLGQTVRDDRRLATVRRLAEKAWQEKKYQGVVFLYRSIREYLTPDEAQRLEYAYEHVPKESST